MTSPMLGTSVGGRYQLLRVLGTGGTATVYLARDQERNSRVALKAVREDLSKLLDPALFLREIEVTSTLRHRHIVPILDSGTWDGWPYFVMPYLPCRSLRYWLHPARELTWRYLASLTRQVAGALDHAHQRGVVHLDIKPENILLSRGRVYLADFGIARLLCSKCRDIGLPGLPEVLGTPDYMSPEQAVGSDALDHRSDIYSLASVIYEAVAGRPPFTGGPPEAVLYRHTTLPAPSLRSVRPQISPDLDRAIAAALSKAPAERPATASRLADAVRREALRHQPREAVGAYSAGLLTSLVVTARAPRFAWSNA